MFRASLSIFIFYLLFSDCIEAIGWAGGGGGGRSLNGGTKGRLSRGYYGDRAYEHTQSEPTTEKKSSKPNVKQNSRGHGLSAWGIVGIVLAVILGSMLVYYTFIFYPILCKKERKYNTIELDAV
ncbi:uncharacterized protein [Anabrus simplex]|uniref:uncharacterized protein n=1 Tax=Anabrus simplex TaxID=316456 RepID=UPI0035A2D6D7